MLRQDSIKITKIQVNSTRLHEQQMTIFPKLKYLGTSVLKGREGGTMLQRIEPESPETVACFASGLSREPHKSLRPCPLQQIFVRGECMRCPWAAGRNVGGPY